MSELRIVMKIEEFIAGVKEDLGDFVHESGVVLYSSPRTLKPGEAYLLGINPGSDPDALDDPDIGAHLNGLPATDKNSYLDAEWDRGRPGQDKFQRRVVWLLWGLGLDPREVCSSNLIFKRSSGQNDSGYPETAHRCWPVHQRILRAVQPKLIICLGNVPFEYICSRGRHEGAPDEFPSGHGSWRCRALRVQLEGRPVEVVSLPHFSHYDVIGKNQVVEWIRTRWSAATRGDLSACSNAANGSSSVEMSIKPQTDSANANQTTTYARKSTQIPLDGFIVLTGKEFSANGARGRAWNTLHNNGGIRVRDWIPIAKKAGNPGCGIGDLIILCNERRACVIVDSTGKQIYPAPNAYEK
jgi:hypothetical protein